MNVNISEDRMVTDETISIQANDLKEKINVKLITYKFFKRIIDIIGGLVGVILLIPMTLCIYIARKILKEVYICQ